MKLKEIQLEIDKLESNLVKLKLRRDSILKYDFDPETDCWECGRPLNINGDKPCCFVGK
jgi:hypothetical protein